MPTASSKKFRLTSDMILFMVATVIPLATVFVFPKVTRASLVFTALADAGAALVGLAGIVGVFAFDSIRSTIDRANSEINAISFGITNLPLSRRSRRVRYGGRLVDERLVSIFQRLDYYFANRGKINRWFAASLVCFLAEIVVAVAGLAGVRMICDWRVTLGVALMTLFQGVFFVYALARDATQIASVG